MPVKNVDVRAAYREAYRLARLAAGERYRASKRRTADEHRFINIFGKPYYLLMPLTSLHADNRTAKLWGWINDGRHLEWFNHDNWHDVKQKRWLKRQQFLAAQGYCYCDSPSISWDADDRVNYCQDCGLEWGEAPF